MTETEKMHSHIKDMQELVDRKDLALKLEKNPEFVKLILDGFCEKECARFARQSGDPAMSKEDREASLALAQAAGHLKRYLSMVVTQGFQAEQGIVDAEDELEEIRLKGEE